MSKADKAELVEVSHISKKGSSLRLSIPKKVAEGITYVFTLMEKEFG